MAKQQSFWPPWFAVPKLSLTEEPLKGVVGWMARLALADGCQLAFNFVDAGTDPGPQGPTFDNPNLLISGKSFTTGQDADVTMDSYAVVRMPDVAMSTLRYTFGFGDYMEHDKYEPPKPPPPPPPAPPDPSTINPIGLPISNSGGKKFHMTPGVFPLPPDGTIYERDGKKYKWDSYVSPFGATGWWELVP